MDGFVFSFLDYLKGLSFCLTMCHCCFHISSQHVRCGVLDWKYNILLEDCLCAMVDQWGDARTAMGHRRRRRGALGRSQGRGGGDRPDRNWLPPLLPPWGLWPSAEGPEGEGRREERGEGKLRWRRKDISDKPPTEVYKAKPQQTKAK